MGTKLLFPGGPITTGREQFGFFEDFHDFNTGDRFTSIEADSGASTSLQDAAGGEVDLITGAVDNNEVYIHTTAENFLIANNKPILAECRIQYAEANTDDANIIFGFANAWAANHLQDDAAGPPANYDGAVFYKVDGGTRWQVEYSETTTQTTVDLTAVNSLDGVAKTAGGASYQTLTIEIVPQNANDTNVNFYIDHVLVYVISNKDYTTPTEMDLGIGAKAGSANSETLTVDYIAAYQVR